jgi:hypothetical protein
VFTQVNKHHSQIKIADHHKSFGNWISTKSRDFIDSANVSLGKTFNGFLAQEKRVQPTNLYFGASVGSTQHLYD